MSTTTDEHTAHEIPGASNDASEADETTEAEPETFPREYVEKLRQEAADARVKAKRTDELANASTALS